MSTIQSLRLSKQRFPFDKKVEIYHSKDSNTLSSQYFVFLDGTLYRYTYDNFNWHNNTLLNTAVDNQVLYFPNTLNDKKSLLLLKTNDGVDFYQYEDSNFNILLRSNEYDSFPFTSFGEWNKPGNIIKCGHFYSDKSLIGILSQHKLHGLQFHAVIEEELKAESNPFYPLEKDQQILSNVDTSRAHFFLADLKRRGQENVVMRNRTGLNIYEFSEETELRHLLHVPESSKTNDFKEDIFFPDLTGQPFKDIVLFNTSGLFVYQYNVQQSNYQFIHFNPLFNEQSGWNDKYIDTVRFEDITLDGKQEMFFTGPQGMVILTFNNYTLQWESILDISNLAVPERHGNIVEIVPRSSENTEYPILFMQHEKVMYWAEIVKNPSDDSSGIELPEEGTNNTSTTPSVIPHLIKSEIADEDNSNVLLRDELDCSSIINGVDKNTGKANFKLPLIGLPNFSKNEKINFYYNGNNKDSTVLGVGWSFPVNAILMDHHGSIFPENERYYLLVEDFPQSLIIDSANSTDDVYNFKLSDQESITRVRYFKNDERWEIDFKEIKQVYGRRKDSNDDSISYDLSWEHWRGAGSSTSGQIELPTAWFLTEVRSGQSSVIHYTYDINNLAIPESGKKFTREVYLKTISDNEGNQITFNYESKDSHEFNLPPLKDPDGNYNTKKVQTRYLAGYSIRSYSYRQDVNFAYEVNGGNRLLTKIVQKDDPTYRPVLQFTYKTMLNSHVLIQAILPTAANVEFSYEVIEGKDVSNTIEKIDLFCKKVGNSYKVDYGQDFVLISYINNFNHVALRMFNKELTSEIYSSSSESESLRFPFLGNNSVKYYEVKILEESLVFILDYGDDKDLCLFDKEKDKWSLTPKCFNYGRDADIQIGNDFIAVLDARKILLEIISLDKKSKKWTKEKMENRLIENSTDSLLRVSGKVFFIYDDNVVTVTYRNKEGKWQSKPIITLPGLFKKIANTSSKFDLDSYTHQEILKYLNSNAFQISNNFVVFNRWSAEGTKFYSEIELFSLNSKYEVGLKKHYKVYQDDLAEIAEKSEVTLNNIKIDLILGYKKNGDKFKVFLKNIGKTSQEKINNTLCKNESKECASEVRKEIEKEIVNTHKKPFLLNLQKYFTRLQSSMATCGSAKFTFTGNDWEHVTVTEQELKPEKWSIFLDDKFVLEQDNSQSSIKLYNQNKNNSERATLDLQVKDVNQIFNKYPKYLVYQTESEDVKVVFYELIDNGIIEKFTLPPGETLSVKSGSNILVTHAQSTSNNKTLTLNLRKLFDVKSNLPNPVIKKLTVNFDNDYKRITGYNYDSTSAKVMGNILYYEKTYTIPGNDKSSHGFIEESKNSTYVVNKMYDAQENLVKIVREEQMSNVKKNKTEEQAADDSEYTNSVLFDKTGHLQVAQFYPYEMQDHEVSYYGFEDYEINKIGTMNSTNENRWFFNESAIIKKEFSLTGENYLNLNNTQLLGTFQPRNQNQNYVASCWIRSERGLIIGKIEPYLKAILYTDDNQEIFGQFGEVQFRYDDWNYVEVIIDLFYSKQIYKNLVSKLSIVPNEKPLKIAVIVSPDPNKSLDVDHIRFSPLNSEFQATTYNFVTKEIKETINANGLIKRYLYNDYQDKIASINENGEIEYLNSYTKSSSIDRIVKLKSKIQIQPNEGFYEDFNPRSFVKRWEVDNDLNWKIAPSEISHTRNQFDRLKLRDMHDTFESYGTRLHFSLQSESSVIRFNKVLKLKRTGNRATVAFSKKVRNIPTQGEILLIAENNRLMVWIDGGLYFDEGGLDKLLFDIQMYGKIKVRDVLLFFQPSVHVTYFNALGEKVQEINLESANSAMVTEFLYDELGRQCVTTKSTRLERAGNQKIVAYYSDFVTNKNPLSIHSVWKLGRIQGAFKNLESYNFYQVTYQHNPLNENSVIGLPGQEFSVSGKFAKRFSTTTENQFINQHYPVDQNYRYYVEHKLDGVEDIKVFDKRNNTVALLIKAPGEKDLLATYEYNNDGQLVQMLTPLYHNKAGTLHNINNQLKCSSKGNNEHHNLLRVANSYDKMGNIINKTTSDSGKVEYLYSDGGQLKFNIFYSNFNSNAIENVIYFDYDYLGRLTNTGKLISPPAKEKLLNLTLTENNTEEYQLFYYSDFEREPTLRGKLKRSITHNDGMPFVEESLLNEDKTISSKRIILLNGNSTENIIIAINKRYKAGKLREIEYPVNLQGSPIRVTYNYDKLGRIEGIGLPVNKNLFVKYTYNSEGHIETEHHLPERINFNFTRKYNYNSASFLTRLEDKFLTENIYYTEGSYGDRGHGDGTITRTEFEATWHKYTDNDKISLNDRSFISKNINHEESKLCFNKLKSAGYINRYNRQAKIYYPLLEVDFPRVCSEGSTGRYIQNILGKQGFPSKYGHLYNYGAYQELIKAKYFIGEDIPAPLQPDTFAKEVPEIDITKSHDIWSILNDNKYIVADRAKPSLIENPYFRPHGKKGLRSIIRSTLTDDLAHINRNYKHYKLPLEKALTSYYSKQLDLSSIKSNLTKAFSEWSKNKKQLQKDGSAIMKMLEEQKYFEKPLDKNFNDLLKKYEPIIPNIVKVLLEHFGKELGEAEFDIEAYKIDENGNHKHFYSGFERSELKYRCNSNQIEAINVHSFALPKKESVFPVMHDSRGNVIQALHKGIKNITYHPVSNRATSMELVSGKKIIFHYDAQGERVLKQVLDATGSGSREVTKQVHYIRDEFGRSLVERELTWSSPTLPPNLLVTVFIYGPKGLVGFIRRDEYYSVITDHEGSVRLVVKDGEVVAAYDYLPYGNLMRQYGTNSEAHVSYRYTGQEWDEETDLYNYHARFYDPSIGRFYQHDPKMQYFSPYKYAGNSPISLIDPNGEEAFFLILLITALGTTGAYLGGAAVSGKWNPALWDYKDPKLYAGIIFGGISGALVPIALPASVTAFTAIGLSSSASIALTVGIGAVGAYAGMARAASEWNPAKWDFSKPELWNGGFVGFVTFAGAPGGLHQAVGVFRGLSSIWSQSAFIAATVIAGGGSIALRLSSGQYDFSKPEVYYDLLESVIFAADVPIAAMGGYRFFKTPIRNLKAYGSAKWKKSFRGYETLHELPALNTIWKSVAKVLVGITIPSLAGVFISAVYNEGGLDFTSATTYETFINGAVLVSGFNSHAHTSYKKREHKIKRKVPGEILGYAEKSVDAFLHEIKQGEIKQGAVQTLPEYKDYSQKVKDALKKEQIPNTVVSVAKLKDGVVFVAYSGLNNSPGFFSSFKFEKKFHDSLAKKNGIIGNKAVAVNDNEILRDEILRDIKQKKEDLIQSSRTSYLENKVTLHTEFAEKLSSIDRKLHTSYFNEHDIIEVLQEIEKTIETNGHLTNAQTMFQIISNPIFRKLDNFVTKKSLQGKLKKISLKQDTALLLEIEEEIAALERKVGLPETIINKNLDFKEKIDLLKDSLMKINNKETEINNHLKQLKGLQENGQNFLDNLYQKYFKQYSDKFTFWDVTNCAEPHVISFLMRTSDMGGHPLGEYTIHDVEYLAAYQIKQKTTPVQLEPKERCSNCQETTKTVKNVVTDEEWIVKLQRESEELEKLQKSLKFNFYPYYSITKVHNATNKEKEKSSRKKRLTVDNYINNEDFLINANDVRDNLSENYENQSDYAENDKTVGIAHEEKKNFASNVFGWMKTSLNNLLYSKKILPEKASMPNALKGISDSSNTNFTAATALVDVNSTILLLDTLVRKVTGQKYISGGTDHETSLLEARGYSLDVGLAFEKTIKYAASKSGISMHRFNVHYMDVQEEVIDKITSGRLDEIADILISHVEKVCPTRENGCPGKLSAKKFNKFMKEFTKRIDAELNEIMQANKSVKGV